MSLTGQWQFSEGQHHVGMCTFTKVSLTGQWQFQRVDTMWGCAPLQNCHWPVNDNFGSHRGWVITENCHWSVNDNFFAKGVGYHRKLSLTGQWHFLRQSHRELVKAENHWPIILVMDIPLMAKCHWWLSMTKIYGHNWEKNVIDHGQWQKNCHWLKVLYPILEALPLCISLALTGSFSLAITGSFSLALIGSPGPSLALASFLSLWLSLSYMILDLLVNLQLRCSAL